MSTTATILNLILSAGVILGIVGGLTWAIVTQHRNHPAYIVAVRRGRPRRRQAADRARQSVRQPVAWPAH